jgi:eukaryotic-like serine/threonine-protein kinase
LLEKPPSAANMGLSPSAHLLLQESVMPVTLSPQNMLGPYRLLNAIYTGKSAQIWQAQDEQTHRLAGIKTLKPDFQTSARHINYLRWEHKVSQNVKHPRILDVFAFAVDGGVPYAVMQWFPSLNAKQLIKQGAINFQLLSNIIDQAADGLAYFHLRGWVHRDIKPENFLVAANGDVRLIDFSLARRAKRGLAKFFSRKSIIQGTRSYMSPEQIRGKPLDARADVYGFGCMLYELIAGKPPFTGANQAELFDKHLSLPPPVLDPAKHNVTPDFARLVERMLAKNPKDRPASAGQCLTEIRGRRVFRTTTQHTR